MKNIFTEEVANEIIGRIQRLHPTSKPLWGKMSADQMLAHCNVAYQFTYESDQYQRPGAVKRWLLRTFLKNSVTGDKPYAKNSRTAPEFIIVGKRDFAQEKARLIGFVTKTQQLGADHFEGKENFSFGPMTAQEWNGLFYKHLDHHLMQFGV